MLLSSGLLNSALLLLVVICALSVVTSQHKSRKLLIELQKEKEFAYQMEVEWGQLQLEQSTWATQGRIGQIAEQTLRMRLPSVEQIKLIRIEPNGQSIYQP